MYYRLIALMGIMFVPSISQAEEAADFFTPNVPTLRMRDPRLNPAVIFAGKDLLLSNRGSAISKESAIYEKGVDISGATTFYEGGGTYNENVTVVLHSTGKHRAWPGEVESGLGFCFEAHTKKVFARLFSPKGDKNISKAVISVENGKAYKWRILEEKKIIKIYWDDLKTPVLIIEKPDEKFGDHYIVIYDREAVGGVSKSCKVSNLKVVALP